MAHKTEFEIGVDPREIAGNRANGHLASSPESWSEPIDAYYNPYNQNVEQSPVDNAGERVQPIIEETIYQASVSPNSTHEPDVQVVKQSDGTSTTIRIPRSLA